MNTKQILTGLLIAGAGYGAFVLYRQAMLLKKSCIKFGTYRIEKFDLKSITLIVTLKIKNKSGIDLIIHKTDFKAYLNNTFVSKIKTKEKILVAANSESEIEVAIDFNPKEVLQKGVQELLTSFGQTSISIKGKLTVISSRILLNTIAIDETILLSDILKPGSQQAKC